VVTKITPNGHFINAVREYLHHSPIHLIFAGASSIGKTTMCETVSNRIKIPVISEIARTIISQNGWSRENLTDQNIFFSLQELIIQQMTTQELNLRNKSHCSDRSIFDPLVYATIYLEEKARKKLASNPVFNTIGQLYQNSIFIIIKPKMETMKDDGIRILPDLESSNTFNRLLIDLLRKYHLLYIEIDATSITDREIEIYKKIISPITRSS